MKPVLSILIPTYNNPQQLNACVDSIIHTGFLNTGLGEVIIVNNGKQNCTEYFRHITQVKVINCPENLGWEGGLKEGLKHTEAKFVCFQNDDTHIPSVSCQQFYQNLLCYFSDDKVAAVGPVTTTAAGLQSIYHPKTVPTVAETRWLIFFTVIVRRSALEEAGGIDNTLPGGDDFDLSIRLRKAGYKLLISPQAFLIHHGFQTGTRIHGDQNKIGGWNSAQMTERTNQALIRKHGFKLFFETLSNQLIESKPQAQDDIEGQLIRSEFNWDTDKVLDLACGFQKTHPLATGVDRVPKGETIPLFYGVPTPSVADVTADIIQSLPFEEGSYDGVIARHIIEHCPDMVCVIRNWIKPLKVGGKLVIATPDDKVVNGIPLSSDHVHSLTSEALKNIAELCGLRQLSTRDTGNGISFYSVFEKLPICSGTMDRLYDGDISTHSYRPQLVQADGFYGGAVDC